jgi:hypothetical protein
MSAEGGKRVSIIIPLHPDAVSQLVKTKFVVPQAQKRNDKKKRPDMDPAKKKKESSFVSIYKIHAFVFFPVYKIQ